MACHKTNDPGHISAWKANVSVAMKKVAASKTCRSCGRGNALGAKKTFAEDRFSVRQCRYCGFEQVTKF